MSPPPPDGTQGLTPTAADDGKGTLGVRVEVTDGAGQGVTAWFARGTMLVGTDADCDLRLEDPTVSRHHAQLELLRDHVAVRDLGSKNGTKYQHARISEARVPVGGSVMVGRTRLTFRAKEDAVPASDRTELHGMLGTSLTMRQLFAMLERLGPLDTTVLLRGETGSGKEMAARALHALSARAAKPFVVFDCASASASLIESQLFGHARGSFTGASAEHVGALAEAEGGTLFLDEVGELPLEVQPKLLRLLGDREYRPLGEAQHRRADVRILASTHRDLEAAVAAGTFRRELFFRLGVTALELPALRARPEDIRLLAGHFARELKGVDVTLAPATLAALQCRQWTGNVRELKNVVGRALALGTLEPSGASNEPRTFAELLHAFEHDYLTALLERNKDNVSAAAREAKIGRSQFYRLLERHGLTP